MVIYKPLYGEGKIWVRPISMWDQVIEKDGQKLKRLTWIEGVGDEN